MKRRRTGSFVTAVVAILLSGIRLALAQTNATTFFADYAAFSATGGFTYVEYYIHITYDRLHFARSGNHYQAVYEIDLSVEDRDGNLVRTHSGRDTVTVSDYDESRAPDKYRVHLIGSYLRPGDYRLRVILTDKETGQSSEIQRELPVRDFSGRSLTLSDIQFSRNIVVDSSTDPFVKNDRRIDPNVLHLYGEFADQLFIYFEVYNLTLSTPAVGMDACPKEGAAENKLSAADSFRTTFTILDEKGRKVKQFHRGHRKPGPSCLHSLALPIDDLPSGQYTLLVRVVDRQTESSSEASGQFTIAWHPLSFKDYTYEELLEQLHFIATREELRQLSNLPETERQPGLLKFWQRRDPTPGTALNEAMEEFYRRVCYAHRQFKWYGGKGWKSPQGQIYITYGPPDEIHRGVSSAFDEASDPWLRPPLISARPDWSLLMMSSDMQLDRKPFAVWEYHQLNRRFVFVDERGTGIYVLIDPVRLKD